MSINKTKKKMKLNKYTIASLVRSKRRKTK